MGKDRFLGKLVPIEYLAVLQMKGWRLCASSQRDEMLVENVELVFLRAVGTEQARHVPYLRHGESSFHSSDYRHCVPLGRGRKTSLTFDALLNDLFGSKFPLSFPFNRLPRNRVPEKNGIGQQLVRPVPKRPETGVVQQADDAPTALPTYQNCPTAFRQRL